MKKWINIHAAWYRFAKCNLDRCNEQHSNNISIIISEKIKQQTKELFALIKFQEIGTSGTLFRHLCGIWTCLGFIQNLRHPQNGFFEKLYLSTHITLIFFSRPSPLPLPLYHSLKRVISFGYVWRPEHNISKEVKNTSYSWEPKSCLTRGFLWFSKGKEREHWPEMGFNIWVVWLLGSLCAPLHLGILN